MQDSIITLKDPYSKKEVFGRIIFKGGEGKKASWFVYIPQSSGKKLILLTDKIKQEMVVIGNYNDNPEKWDLLLKGDKGA